MTQDQAARQCEISTTIKRADKLKATGCFGENKGGRISVLVVRADLPDIINA
jgi:hypothetical protein